MDFSQKLILMRKAKGWSQEQLGEQIGVTRQTVSKWELGDTTPEMDKLIALADLFGVSLDELAGREAAQSDEQPQTPPVTEETIRKVVREAYHYEYRSKAHIGSLPLVHINLGRGMYRAKGVIAIGNIAMGLISFGVIGLGLLSLASISLGLIAMGALAFGGLAVGGVALGFFAVGGVAIGVYTIGGVAIGSEIALGGYARGDVAIGHSAHGTVTAMTEESGMKLVDKDSEVLKAEMIAYLKNTPRWIIDLFVGIVS